MNRRLLVDSLGRGWVAVLIGFKLGAALWLLAGIGLITSGTAIAASMVIATWGVIQSSQLVAPKEVLTLPIGRTGIWRTRFFFGTVIFGLARAAGKLAALTVSATWPEPVLGLDAVVISFVLDVVASALYARVNLGGPATEPWRTGFGIFVIACPILPFTIAGRLPVSWEQLSPTWLALIAIGVATVVRTYFRMPAVSAASGTVDRRASLKVQGRDWLPEFAHVTGLRRLLLDVWTTALVIQVGTMIFLPLVLPLLDVFAGEQSGGGWLYSAREFGLTPFEHGNKPPNWLVYWIFASVGNDGSIRMIRHLRALPISTHGLVAVLLSVSFVTWASAWLVFAIFQAIATGNPPETWRLPMLAGVIGGDTLFRAFQLRWRQPVWLFMAMVVVAVPAVAVLAKLPISADVLFVGIGFGALCAATILNHRTLTNSRTIYARVSRQTAFGTELPG